jgi:glycosyltransferase involved in cell wall biosynthesis
MKVSVVIITRNEENYIRDLLDSLVAQTVTPYEIIIVDAESTDNTQKIIRRYMRTYDFVKLYIELGTRGEGRNYGAKKATGDIIAFIDADCIANAFWVQEIIEGMKKADVVAGKSVRLGYQAFSDLQRVGILHKDTDVTYPSCNLAYSKKTFKKIRGFDPSFKEAEEVDLNFRAVDAGYKLIYHPEAIVYHRVRESIRGFVKQSFWYGFGRKELTLKHGSLWSKYNVIEMLKITANESIWKLIRLFISSFGYFTCKFLSRSGTEKKKKQWRESKLSER